MPHVPEQVDKDGSEGQFKGVSSPPISRVSGHPVVADRGHVLVAVTKGEQEHPQMTTRKVL